MAKRKRKPLKKAQILLPNRDGVPKPFVRHLTFGEVLALLVTLVLAAVGIIALFLWPLEIAGGLLFFAVLVGLYAVYLFNLPLLKRPRFTFLCLAATPIAALLFFVALPKWVIAARPVAVAPQAGYRPFRLQRRLRLEGSWRHRARLPTN
jgi:hypothetical protein